MLLIFASTLAIRSDAALLFFASVYTIRSNATLLIFPSALATRSGATPLILASASAARSDATLLIFTCTLAVRGMLPCWSLLWHLPSEVMLRYWSTPHELQKLVAVSKLFHNQTSFSRMPVVFGIEKRELPTSTRAYRGKWKQRAVKVPGASQRCSDIVGRIYGLFTGL